MFRPSRKLTVIPALAIIPTILCLSPVLQAATGEWLSHPPQRPLPVASKRPMNQGEARFVHPLEGNDNNPGTNDRPWRTVNHACKQLQAGQTLYLRGGVYFENVYCAVAGKPDAPITIRSFPGELAIIDGSIRQFQDNPATAWEPVPGAEGEYRSTTPYRNLRDVLGRFADSLVGLETYWHHEDLQARNEQYVFTFDNAARRWTRPAPPMYCGPGLFYDKQTGYIHARLAHTNLRLDAVPDYRGQTDPRNLPLVVAPFASVPLTVDQAMHVRFMDLVVRGGGYYTVQLRFGVDVKFDHVTVYAGTYGIWSAGTGPLSMTNCAIRGGIPPWAFRTENALYTYDPKYQEPFVTGPEIENCRNFARLPTHSVLVTDVGGEFDVFHLPFNHDWRIEYCEFTDSHDGPYVSGRNIIFAHNWVDNMQDDGIFLSGPAQEYSDNVHIVGNLITGVLNALALDPRGGPSGNVFIYRNVVDMRRGVNRDRPTPQNPKGMIRSEYFLIRHGGGPHITCESLYFFHNTVLANNTAGDLGHRTLVLTTEDSVRRSFNNIFVYMSCWPSDKVLFGGGYGAMTHDLAFDGNLHWCPKGPVPDHFLKTARECAASQRMKQKYPDGWATHDVVADPGFVNMDLAESTSNDYRLRNSSAAVNAGVPIPARLAAPLLDTELQKADDGRPDIGAIPLGAPAPRYGCQGRITLPITAIRQP